MKEAPFFKMSMGSKEKDTPGTINEKQSGIMKAAPMFKYADGPLTAPGDMYAAESAKADSAKSKDQYSDMAASFDAGMEDGKELAGAIGKKKKKKDALQDNE